MTVYCYRCCNHCKNHRLCDAREGGCEKCDYWTYGECRNRNITDSLLYAPSKVAQEPGRPDVPGQKYP